MCSTLRMIRRVALSAGSIFLSLYLGWWLLNQFRYVNWFTHFSVIGSLLVVAWTAAYSLFDYFNTKTVKPTNKAVLITGCDSGFGHRLAKRLDNYVYAGVLFPEGDGAKELREQCSKRIRILKMDVTKQEDVQSVVQQIGKSKMPLWAVVNNAGIALGCPFDWGNDVDEYKKTFDVNVFGLVRVTKHCMPLLRESRGRVVNIASVAGRMTVPMMGHYCMAKHSVRVFSDVLRRELYHDGVKVITLEPTFYKTPIINFEQINRTRERIYQQTPDDIKEAYSESAIKSLNNMESMVDLISRNNLDEVVNTMERAVTLRTPKAFYRCSGVHEIAIWAASHLPETILDVIISGVIYNKHTMRLANRYISLFKDKQKST